MREKFSFGSALILSGMLLIAGYGWAQMKGSDQSGSSSFSDQSSGRNAPSSRDTGRGSGTSSSSGSESVKKVQQALKDKGQDPGPIDGVMGEKTTSALKAYQSANNLKATGTVDSETAKSLGVEPAKSFSDRSSGRNAPSARDKGRGTGTSGTTATGSDTSGSSSYSDQPSGRNAPSSRDPSTK